jgi:hypothetical protein
LVISLWHRGFRLSVFKRHFLLRSRLSTLLLDGRGLIRSLHLYITQESDDFVL